MEENKSTSSPKYQGSAILDLMILPHRMCWMCNITFKTTNDQNEHFFTEHFCNFCERNFNNLEMKMKHESNGHKCNFKVRERKLFGISTKTKLCNEIFPGDTNTFLNDKARHLREVHKGKQTLIII